uniref:Uncharacterized protein n=1 Tax=Arundo donax TaxID=35708 RepID=A0A0A9G6V4_ARUDO
MGCDFCGLLGTPTRPRSIYRLQLLRATNARHTNQAQEAMSLFSALKKGVLLFRLDAVEF